jgi:four helix bundle protein
MIGITVANEKGFRRLLVWKQAHKLVLMTYHLTNGFPKKEMFGLASQFQRAAVSVPANIAEGHGAGGSKQFERYLHIAQGSLAEVEYYLILARDLGYITNESYMQAETLRGEVGFLLYKLLKSQSNSS